MSLRKSWEFWASQLFFFIFVLVCFMLRHRGLSFFDASDFATAIQGAGIPHAPGYPLYVMLGKFFNLFTPDPFDAQFWLNIVAAWVTGFFLFITCSENRKTALLTVLFLYAQSLFQQYILIPEVFTLNLSLISILIYFHKRLETEKSLIWVLGIGFIYGLGFCHHHLMAVMVPASLFLLGREFRKTSLALGLGVASFGFLIGILPLSYLFYTSSLQPDYTYFNVQNISDLLFVVLRKGYGTFRMTGNAGAVSAAEVLSMTSLGLLQSTGYIVFVAGLIAIPFFWMRKKPVGAIPILTTLGVAVFAVLFCAMTNFPDTLEAKKAFLRYLSVPGFLLLHPFSFACDWLAKRFGKGLYIAGAAIAVILAGISFSRLDYRHYPLIDFQVEQAFKTIDRVVSSQSDSEVDSRYKKCVIFTVTDPFHFGGRYYNEFQTKERCYFYSFATVITGQFQAQAELKLMLKYLGEDYVLLGKNREVVFLDFFSRVQAAGYRVFFIYADDLAILKEPRLLIAPVGGVVELIRPETRMPQESLVGEYIRYLESLKALLDELELNRHQPDTLSAAVVRAPFVNVNVYPKLVALPAASQGLEKEIRQRSEKFIQETSR